MDKQQRITEFSNALREALAVVRPDLVLEGKSMFGGAGFFADSKIFAAWFGNGLALKLSTEDRQALLTQVEQSGVPIHPDYTPSPQYVEVPQAFLDDPAQLVPWIEKSLSYALAEKPRKPRKGRG